MKKAENSTVSRPDRKIPVNYRRWICLALLFPPLLANAVTEYGFTVVRKLPHSRSDFVQGLEIRGGKLYQGTGIRGASRLQVFDLESGTLLRSTSLPRDLFGEGITVLDDRIVQLTWRARRGLVYRRDTLEKLAEFSLPGEGWGLTNDGSQLIYSDGSDKLHFVSAGDWTVKRSLPVRLRGRPLHKLNELEWTPDYLLANVWGLNGIAMIDLESGNVTGIINLNGLLPTPERRFGTDVLNGIAVNHDTGELWVTGKNWPWLYQIELRPKNTPAPR